MNENAPSGVRAIPIGVKRLPVKQSRALLANRKRFRAMTKKVNLNQNHIQLLEDNKVQIYSSTWT